MHILFLTDNFPPEVNAPASRTFEHCREWVKAGHKVTVITGAPNFPAGKVFDGYANKWRTRETLQGIEVTRVWTYISANEGFLKRTLDYASFMISGALAALGVRDVDVIVATSPQLFTPCAAYVAGLLKRRLAGATQQQPGLLRKDYRSYERNTAGNWIVDHTDVFRAQRS